MSEQPSVQANTRWPPTFGWLLCAIVAGGALMRALPLLYFGSTGSVADYDEGVYFAAAAAVARGALPYRDFVYAHPPGFLWLWSIMTRPWLHADAEAGFAVARWLTVAVGALNITAIGGVAKGPNSYFGGVRSSFDSIAIFHVICWPV